VDFRKSILRGEVSNFTCLLGTLVQEAYETNPAIRAACDQYISAHAATVEADIAEVMRVRGMVPGWSASSASRFYIQSVLQGSFILAKAKHGPAVAADCIDHLRRYLELFVQNAKGENAMTDKARVMQGLFLSGHKRSRQGHRLLCEGIWSEGYRYHANRGRQAFHALPA
jgi:hypothetical protein